MQNITAVSPQETLKRGYSITWRDDGTLITSSDGLNQGEKIRTQFSDTSVISIIDSK